MLRYLALYTEWYGPLRVFDSLTFRAFLALTLAFVAALAAGPAFLRTLCRLRATEDVSKPDCELLDHLHRCKGGTPTMGGLLLLGAALVAILLACDPLNLWVQLGALGLVLFGALGFIDDYRKLRKLENRGLTKWEKLAGQAVVAALLAAGVWALHTAPATTKLLVPFTRWAHFQPDLGIFYYPFFVFVLVSCSNAVNLTDGLDGLAPGAAVSVTLAFAALAYVVGNEVLCAYFRIPFVAGSGELSVFCAAMTGALMGFLWFNAHPAHLFMGDTGSLPLGAVIAFVALVIKQEIVLILIGLVFVFEALSVLLQVVSFRLRGKRIFKCAPFHHHLEFCGWHENQVVVRLWLVGVLAAALGLATLKMH